MLATRVESPSDAAMDPLRHAGASREDQHAALDAILRSDAVVWPALLAARELALPDWMIVSGVIYNAVWNALSGYPSGHGTKDIDLFYCDAGDLSWEAEDAVIRTGMGHFAHLPLPVEIRNQARVHLWYRSRFGRDCPAYRSSAESLSCFASRTHAVGVRLTAEGNLEIEAPFGLDDMFGFRVTPNRTLDNRETHHAKGARAMATWPLVTVEPW